MKYSMMLQTMQLLHLQPPSTTTIHRQSINRQALMLQSLPVYLPRQMLDLIRRLSSWIFPILLPILFLRVLTATTIFQTTSVIIIFHICLSICNPTTRRATMAKDRILLMLFALPMTVQTCKQMILVRNQLTDLSISKLCEKKCKLNIKHSFF